MKRILHLSDFHITFNSVEPEKCGVIREMINVLRSKEIDISVLVYTGDIIDSKEIRTHIESCPYENREEMWNKLARKSFDVGVKYFEYIIKELEILPQNVIICCGNHDVNRYVQNNDNIDCSTQDIRTSKKRFAEFKRLCEKINLQQDMTQNYFRSIEGFNFLVINSNWSDNIKKSKHCINCSEVINLLNSHKKELIETINTKCDSYNIFVSHAPDGEICEEAQYSYKTEETKSLIKEIKDLCGLSLKGDKHVLDQKDQTIIAGAPLCEERISYVIYEYSDSLQPLIRIISYYSVDNLLTIKYNSSAIQMVLSYSINYLKSSGINKLTRDKKTEIQELADLINRDMLKEECSNYDKLFKSIATLKQPEIGTSGKKVEINNGLIGKVVNIIQNSSTNFPLTLKGMPKLGKSLFFTVLYVVLLTKFSIGEFKYIPLYFNIDTLICGNEGNKWENVKTRFYEFISSGQKLSSMFSKPVCFIVDGLSDCIFYQTQIEEFIVETMKTRGEKNNRYVLGVDIDKNLNLSSTCINNSIETEFILYFNQLTINNVDSSNKYSDFISAFSKIYTNVDASVIKQNIDKLYLQKIDLNTLVNFQQFFVRSNLDTCITQMYSRLANKYFSSVAQKSIACEACYKLYYENKTFDQIVTENNSVNEYVFEIIRKQKKLSLYLLALYYVNQMKNAINSNSIGVDDGILNENFGYEISTFIKGIIEKNNLIVTLRQFEKKYYKQASFRGKSTITYLLGRVSDIPEHELEQILNNQEKNLGKYIKKIKNYNDKFFYLIARRSITISRISKAEPNSFVEHKYINILLSNDFERMVNREFYLIYYGDIRPNDIHNRIEGSQPHIFEGFDIFNLYHVLATKLKKWIDCLEDYSLLQIEIFTLCDLIQQRLDHSQALTRNNRYGAQRLVPSFFFDGRQVEKAKQVLKFMIELVSKYIEQRCVATLDYNELFACYLSEKKREFECALSRLNQNKNIDIFIPEEMLFNCTKLSRTARAGWSFNSVLNNIDKAQYDKQVLNSNTETVLEHIYECYLIGLFYLPNSAKEDKYCKQTILNMLLIHDIGESYTGDYPPFYNQIAQIKNDENRYNVSLFLSGLHDGVSDLIDYLSLWNSWSNSENNINILIAKEIDIIQMIYKMFLLLDNGRICFEKERICSVIENRSRIRTIYGKQIYRILISGNDKFLRIANEYNIQL